MRSGDKARNGQVATSPSVLAFRCWSNWSTQSSIPDLSVPPRISRCPHFFHTASYLLYPLTFVGPTGEMWALLQLDFLKCARAQICPHSKAAMFSKTGKIKEACRLPTGWASSSRLLHARVFLPSSLPLIIPLSFFPAITWSGWNLSCWY